MPIANTKIIQSYIQGLNEVINLLEQADAKAQEYKAKFIAKNPDLSGTNITQTQIGSVNVFISDLNALVSNAVVSAIKNKTYPSHGTSCLD